MLCTYEKNHSAFLCLSVSQKVWFFVQISLSPHPCILPLRSIHSAAFFLRNNNPAEYGTILRQKQRAIFTDPLQRQYALQRHTREKTVLTIEPARLIQEPLDYNKKGIWMLLVPHCARISDPPSTVLTAGAAVASSAAASFHRYLDTAPSESEHKFEWDSPLSHR